MSDNKEMHVLSIYVENHAGVLSRISGLFSRRMYNIDSLSVGETENPKISRMTIVTHADDNTFRQIQNQLAKLEDVTSSLILGTRQIASQGYFCAA